jgi:GMP synthase (glutamine-hydrolysing)
VDLWLNAEAREDPLLRGFVSPIPVLVSHHQSVLVPPGDAIVLASSALEPVQAFVVGQTAWGVQFHPEFSAEATIAYVEHFRDALLAAGLDPDWLVEGCVDTPVGPEILGRFAAFADSRQ